MKKAVADRLVGRLGKTSKMPCKSFGLSPAKCRRGTSLRKIKNTVCSNCYACQGMYHGAAVKEAHERRYQRLDHPLWPGLMAEAIGRDPFFRWFDAGDVQSLKMLDQIMEVCERTPNTRHWLPTRETAVLKKYLAAGGRVPSNLTIRVSLDHIDGDIGQRPIEGLPISVVSKESRSDEGAFNCPSDDSGELSCDHHQCRACWDKTTQVVNYVEQHQKG
jgi:hypothetical protein